MLQPDLQWGHLSQSHCNKGKKKKRSHTQNKELQLVFGRPRAQVFRVPGLSTVKAPRWEVWLWNSTMLTPGEEFQKSRSQERKRESQSPGHQPPHHLSACQPEHRIASFTTVTGYKTFLKWPFLGHVYVPQSSVFRVYIHLLSAGKPWRFYSQCCSTY